MRFLHWLSVGVVSALGVFSSVGGTFRIFNSGGSAFSATLRVYQGAGCTGSSYMFTGGVVSPGSSQEHYVDYPGAYVSGKWFISECGVTTCRDNAAGYIDTTYYYPGCSETPAATNAYCVYHVVWTNQSDRAYAAPIFYFNYVTNNQTVLYQGDWTGAVVGPGKYFDRWITNAPLNGECGALGIADERLGDMAPFSWYQGTPYMSVPVVPNAYGDDSGGQLPIVDPTLKTNLIPLAQRTTNAPNQLDTYIQAAAIVQAVSEVEDAVERNNKLTVASTATNAAGFNLVGGAINGMNTNLNRLIATNSAGFSGVSEGLSNVVNAIGTNWSGIGTNTALVASILAGWTNGLTGAITNLNTNFLNEAGWDVGASNIAGPFGDYFKAYTEGISGIGDEMISQGNATEIEDDFGVLRVRNFQQEVIWEYDLKPVLRMDPMETYLPGFRGWLRIIAIWAAIGGCIFWLIRELREAIWHALTPPSDMKSNSALMAMAAAPLGPVGSASAAAAGLLYKGGRVVGLVAGLLLLPSICVGVAATTYQWFGFDDLYLAASGQTAVSTAPSAMWKIISLFSPWFPVIELCIISLNMLIAQLGLDGTVSLLMVYVKVKE